MRKSIGSRKCFRDEQLAADYGVRPLVAAFQKPSDTPHRSVPPAVAGGSITLSAMVELRAHPLSRVLLTRLFLPREARPILSSVDKSLDHSP